jgi:hypothetical protein
MRLDFRGAKHKAHLLIVRAIFRSLDGCDAGHRHERKEPAVAFSRAQAAGAFRD